MYTRSLCPFKSTRFLRGKKKQNSIKNYYHFYFSVILQLRKQIKKWLFVPSWRNEFNLDCFKTILWSENGDYTLIIAQLHFLSLSEFLLCFVNILKAKRDPSQCHWTAILLSSSLKSGLSKNNYNTLKKKKKKSRDNRLHHLDPTACVRRFTVGLSW